MDDTAAAGNQISGPRRSAAPPTGQPATQPPTCLGRKQDGGVCRGTPTGDGYCPRHSPAFNADQRRQWSQRGAQGLHRRLKHEKTALAHQTAAVAPALPPGVPLPPTPAAEGLNWSDATRIREYLQDLAARVAAGQITVSVAEMLRKLADSTLKVVDVELDMALAKRIAQSDE